MILKYKAETIEKIVNELNQLEIKGLANANRLLIIVDLLNHPVQEEQKTPEQSK